MTRPTTQMGVRQQPLDTSPPWLHIAVARLGPFSTKASTPQGTTVVQGTAGLEGVEHGWRQQWVWFLEHGRQVTVAIATYDARQVAAVCVDDRYARIVWQPGPVPHQVISMHLRMLLPAAP